MSSAIAQELARLDVRLPHHIVGKLETYVKELERWSRKINLTSLEGGELARRLVAEPCWIGQQLQMSGTLVDLGSGNGSPGIPVFLACGLRRAELVEARAKRAAFLRHVAMCIGGKSIVVHRIRLEDMTIAPEADWITLQGVKPTAALLQVLRRLFPSTTRVVWITSGDIPDLTGLSIAVPHSNTVVRSLQLDQF